ncbi:unnamed protein product [Meloidogyne enterolobii]|uniref:Uncharacterized protein n=1 Tax=Meloidogyne enterolobii TaxID=390850 RepID=A0ACB0ZFE0_MELEN
MNRKDHLTCQQIVKFLMIYRNGASQLRTNLEVLQHTKALIVFRFFIRIIARTLGRARAYFKIIDLYLKSSL